MGWSYRQREYTLCRFVYTRASSFETNLLVDCTNYPLDVAYGLHIVPGPFNKYPCPARRSFAFDRCPVSVSGPRAHWLLALSLHTLLWPFPDVSTVSMVYRGIGDKGPARIVPANIISKRNKRPGGGPDNGKV